MIKSIFRNLATVVSAWLLNSYRRLSLDLIKIEAAIGYIKGIRILRRTTIAGLLLLGVLFLLAVGFVFLHIALFTAIYMLSGSWPVVVAVIAVLGGLYCIVPLVILSGACSEKRWMKAFKADTVVTQLTQRK